MIGERHPHPEAAGFVDRTERDVLLRKIDLGVGICRGGVSVFAILGRGVVGRRLFGVGGRFARLLFRGLPIRRQLGIDRLLRRRIQNLPCRHHAERQHQKR